MIVLLHDSQYRYLVDPIEDETEKAILVRGVWLPKSQLKHVEPNVCEVPDWLVDKHLHIFCDFGTPAIRRARVLEMREEMREEKEHVQQRLDTF